jgi:hypothetical protein
MGPSEERQRHRNTTWLPGHRQKPCAIERIALLTGMSKRTRAWSQRERFASSMSFDLARTIASNEAMVRASNRQHLRVGLNYQFH